MRFLSFLAGFLLFLAAFTPVFAQAQGMSHANEAQPDKYVSVQLLTEKTDIQPGETIWVGIHQDIYPHWHTYWKNPGDSGAEAYISWDLPKGFTISDIYWPVPEKQPYEPLLNYGYSDEVVLLQKLGVPADYDGSPVTLNVQTDILVCDDICIPESDNLSVTLGRTSGGEESSLNDHALRLANARKTLPMVVDWDAKFGESQTDFLVEMTDDFSDITQYDRAEFFPLDWGFIQNPEESTITVSDDKITISHPRGDRPLNEVEEFRGVLVLERDGLRTGYAFTAKPGADLAAAPTMAGPSGAVENNVNGDMATSLWQALLLALLGGAVLNLMPCVFPVLSMKALSLAKSAGHEHNHAKLHGIAYTAGILLSFAVIGGSLIILKGLGQEIGWGFQLQNPVIVGGLAYLLFIIGLNLSGLFEITGRFTQAGSSLTQGGGAKSSFFTGVLATLVATPCTAPFMAAALGYALVQPALSAMSVFIALGFGLALPYLAISFVPALQRAMPKPGPWMARFKEFLAFPMFASAAWLLWVVSIQGGSHAVLLIAFGFVALGFGLWLLRFGGVSKAFAVISFIAALGLLSALPMSSPQKNEATSPDMVQISQPYSPELLDEKLEGDDPVFVEMTAAWCITCKVNNAVAINIESTRRLIQQENIQYLVGDWTNKDEQITRFLSRYGRSGVPIYVFYGARNADSGERPEPQILPQILTPGIVQGALSGR